MIALTVFILLLLPPFPGPEAIPVKNFLPGIFSLFFLYIYFTFLILFLITLYIHHNFVVVSGYSRLDSHMLYKAVPPDISSAHPGASLSQNCCLRTDHPESP